MIKRADIQDFESIKKMFINFANSAPVDFLHNPQYDPDHIDQILFAVKTQGVLLVAYDNKQPAGFLIALPAPDVWLPHVKPTLREMAWWVEPEHRQGTIGGKLFLKYLKLAKEMKDNGKINGYTMTLMDKSPDIKLDRYGFRPIETVYYAE